MGLKSNDTATGFLPKYMSLYPCRGLLYYGSQRRTWITFLPWQLAGLCELVLREEPSLPVSAILTAQILRPEYVLSSAVVSPVGRQQRQWPQTVVLGVFGLP